MAQEVVLYTRCGQSAILNRISTKIKSFLPLVQGTIAVKGNRNISTGSLDMLVTDRQTDRQTDRRRQKHYPPPERRAIKSRRLKSVHYHTYCMSETKMKY